MDLIESLSIVDSVKRVTEPFKYRPQVPSRRHDRAGGRRQGRRRKLLHDRGPVLGRIRRADRRVVAKAVKASGANMLRGGAFKPRTSPYDFQGLEARSIELLKIARQETGLPIVTEIMGTNYLPLLRMWTSTGQRACIEASTCCASSAS